MLPRCPNYAELPYFCMDKHGLAWISMDKHGFRIRQYKQHQPIAQLAQEQAVVLQQFSNHSIIACIMWGLSKYYQDVIFGVWERVRVLKPYPIQLYNYLRKGLLNWMIPNTDFTRNILVKSYHSIQIQIPTGKYYQEVIANANVISQYLGPISTHRTSSLQRDWTGGAHLDGSLDIHP